MSIKSTYNNLPKGAKIVIAIVGVTIAGFAAYKIYHAFGRLKIKGDTKHSKAFYASWLIENAFASNRQMTFLLEASEEYVKAWYEAAKKNNTSFTLSGKNYSVQGGKAI